MEYITIPDTAIFAVNRGNLENKSSQIVYRYHNGDLHPIDFDVCAENFKAEHETLSGNCIGERKIDKYYFVFYTSGIKTKIIFKKMYVENIFQNRLLNGSKALRFQTLQNLINETTYTTYDLS